MGFPTPFTVDLRVYSSGEEDAWGDGEPTWAEPEDRAVYGWAPAGTSEEQDAGRNPTQIDLQVFGPAASLDDVKPRDRMIVAGDLYEVDGERENFNYGPFGFTPGVRVNLKRVVG